MSASMREMIRCWQISAPKDKTQEKDEAETAAKEEKFGNRKKMIK